MEVLRLQEHINAMYASRSWRLAAPVRIGGEALRKVGLSPSGVTRNVKLVLFHAAAYVRCRPVLKARISTVLTRFPALRSRLVGLIGTDALRGVVPGSGDEIESVDRLTARGQRVYADLTGAKDSNTP